MTTEISLPTKGTTLRDLIVKNREQIEMALPRFMDVDRLIRTALTSLSLTPRLLDCTPRSLLGAIIQCAQLGLEPGILGMAYLVPFRNTKRNTVDVQLIVGYKGLLALARRSQEISTIAAHLVYSGDEFEYEYGLVPKLVHIPVPGSEKKAVLSVYAVARLKDGGSQFEVMTTDEINAHRDRYSKAAKEGPWVTNWDEMAKKTVLRRLCKLLPASIELHTAVALDERAEAQLPQGLGVLVDQEPEPVMEETPAIVEPQSNKEVSIGHPGQTTGPETSSPLTFPSGEQPTYKLDPPEAGQKKR